MSRTWRSRIALLMLAASGLAFIATSQSPGTTKTVEGETVVAPDHPGTFAARFIVGAPSGATFSYLHISVSAPRGLDPRLALDAATSDGTRIPADSGADLNGTSCSHGCTVDVQATVRWVGPPEAPLSVHWEATLGAAGGEYTEVPVSASVLAGGPPDVPASGWLGLGALVAAATMVVWLIGGRRWWQARLVLIAGMALVPIIGLVDISIRDVGAGIPLSDVAGGLLVSAILVALLAGGVVRAIRALQRGNPTYVAAIAVGYVIVIGGMALVIAASAPTYRPYELVAMGLIVGAPPAAALGSVRVASPGTTRAVRWSSVVWASQIVLIAAYGLAAIPTALAGALGVLVAVTERGPADNLDLLRTALLNLLPTVILALVVVGFVRWRRGDRRLLLLSNVVALIPLLLILVAATAATSLLGPLALLAALPLVAIALAAAAGIVGGLAIPPPNPTVIESSSAGPPQAASDGEQDSGERDEVGGIEDKIDGPDRREGPGLHPRPDDGERPLNDAE
jgi:hypothetical protein